MLIYIYVVTNSQPKYTKINLYKTNTYIYEYYNTVYIQYNDLKINIIKIIVKNINLRLIDDYEIDGDFVESQAFAFLAVRSILSLPITFPNTTGCKKPCVGGELIKS